MFKKNFVEKIRATFLLVAVSYVMICTIWVKWMADSAFFLLGLAAIHLSGRSEIVSQGS